MPFFSGPDDLHFYRLNIWLIIIPYPLIEFKEVDVLKESNRGTGGFGHTGN